MSDKCKWQIDLTVPDDVCYLIDCCDITPEAKIKGEYFIYCPYCGRVIEVTE